MNFLTCTTSLSSRPFASTHSAIAAKRLASRANAGGNRSSSAGSSINAPLALPQTKLLRR